MKYVVLCTLLALFLLSACSVEQTASAPLSPSSTEDSDGEVQMLADGTRYIVHPDNLLSGGPPKDGIPPIDTPKFVSVQEADEWIADDEIVQVVTYNGITRAYPNQIMVWHEIVNDKFDGERVLVTYCPLCGSSIAFKPVVNGQEVEFGTSGKLYNSNLVMYDRLTDSYWSQIQGKAIIGDVAGTVLDKIPLSTVEWGSWKVHNPDAQVLSRDTGEDRDYDRDPYGTYYVETAIFFPVEHEDDRLHPKEPVIGLEINGESRAYATRDLQTIEDELGGVPLIITKDVSGVISVVDDQGNTIAFENDFWFAWFAFHPETTLYS